MEFDWVTFGFQAVNVLVLLAILRHFLFRPIVAIIAKRQQATEAAMDKAAKAQAEAETAAEEARLAAAQTHDARADALSRAATEGEAQRKALIRSAHQEAAKIVEAARAQALQIKEDAGADTLRRARDLAEAIARRALSELPAPPDTAVFAARLGNALDAMSQTARDGLLGGENLRIVSARALTAAELEAIKAILGPFGVKEPGTEVDPGLIAGLDLRSSSGVVRNSLAHSLTQISEALHDDDRPGA